MPQPEIPRIPTPLHIEPPLLLPDVPEPKKDKEEVAKDAALAMIEGDSYEV